MKFFVLILILSAIVVISCKPAAPPPAKKPTAALVVFVGGLAHSQLGVAESMLAGSFPTIQHAHFQPDGWRGNIAGYVAASRYDRLVLIGHSFGCQTVCDAAANISTCDLMIWIDPVCSTPFQRTLTRPFNVKRLIVFVRSAPETEALGIAVRANVVNPDSRLVIPGGHNDLPSNPIVLNIIRDEVGSLTAQASKSLTLRSSAPAIFSSVSSVGFPRPDRIFANASRVIPAAAATSACDLSPMSLRIFCKLSGIMTSQKKEAPRLGGGVVKDSLSRIAQPQALDITLHLERVREIVRHFFIDVIPVVVPNLVITRAQKPERAIRVNVIGALFFVRSSEGVLRINGLHGGLGAIELFRIFVSVGNSSLGGQQLFIRVLLPSQWFCINPFSVSSCGCSHLSLLNHIPGPEHPDHKPSRRTCPGVPLVEGAVKGLFKKPRVDVLYRSRFGFDLGDQGIRGDREKFSGQTDWPPLNRGVRYVRANWQSGEGGGMFGSVVGGVAAVLSHQVVVCGFHLSLLNLVFLTGFQPDLHVGNVPYMLHDASRFPKNFEDCRGVPCAA